MIGPPRRTEKCCIAGLGGEVGKEEARVGLGHFPVVRSVSSPGIRAAAVAPSRIISAPSPASAWPAVVAGRARPCIFAADVSPATATMFAPQLGDEEADPELIGLWAAIAERDQRICELESCLRQRGPAPLASGTEVAAFAELAGALRAAQTAAQEATATDKFTAGSVSAAGAVDEPIPMWSEAFPRQVDDLCGTCGSCRTLLPGESDSAPSSARPQSSTQPPSLPPGRPVTTTLAQMARVPSIASDLRRDIEASTCSTGRSWRTMTPGRAPTQIQDRRPGQRDAAGHLQRQSALKPETGEYSFAAPSRTSPGRASRPPIPSVPTAAGQDESTDPPTVRGSLAARSSVATSGTVSPSSPTPRTGRSTGASVRQTQQQLTAGDSSLGDLTLDVTALNAVTCCPACGSSLTCTPLTTLTKSDAGGDTVSVAATSQQCSLSQSGTSGTASIDRGVPVNSLAGSSTMANEHGPHSGGGPGFLTSPEAALVVPCFDSLHQISEQQPSTADASSQTGGLPASPSDILLDYLPSPLSSPLEAKSLHSRGGSTVSCDEAAVANARRHAALTGTTGVSGDGSAKGSPSGGSGGGEDTDGVEPAAKRATHLSQQGCASEKDTTQPGMASRMPAPPPWPRKLSPPPTLRQAAGHASEFAAAPSDSGESKVPSAQRLRKCESARDVPRPTSHVVLAPAQVSAATATDQSCESAAEPQGAPAVEISTDNSSPAPTRAVTFHTARQSLGRSASLLSRLKRESRGRHAAQAAPQPSPAPVTSSVRTSDEPELPTKVMSSGSCSPPVLQRRASPSQVTRAGSPRPARTMTSVSRQSLAQAQKNGQPMSPKLRHQVEKSGWK